MSRGTIVSGRVAVITGAASGMGRAMAQRLSAQGSPVAICDWNEEGLQETAGLLSGPVLARKLDVSDRQAQLTFAAEVNEWRERPIGMVFNNAGVTVSQSIAEGSHEDDEWLLNVNLWGVIHGTKAYLPILLEQNEGAIVNVSSVFGLVGWPTQSMYCATKHAVKGFTEALRHELRDTGVRAVSVHPGGVATNIVNNARFHVDDQGNKDRSVLEKDFQKVARTSPEKAAKIIHTGVEAGKSRVLVGPDAQMLDKLARFMPSHYFDVIKRLEPLVRR